MHSEFDFGLTPAYSQVFFNNKFKHKVLVSATCDEKKLTVLNKIVPIVYTKIAKDAEKAGALNKAKIYFVNFMLYPDENKEYIYFNSKFVKLLNYQTRNPKALEMLQWQRKLMLSNLRSSKEVTHALIPLLLKDPKNKIVIFTGTTEQAELLHYNTYHSKQKKNENLEKFNNGDERVVVVVGKIDRGQNLKGANNIVFTAITRSKTKTSQRTGRGRRLDEDDFVHIFFLIPYYKTIRGEIRPTVVLSQVIESSEDLNLKHARTIRYEHGKKVFA
jgi:superfamily II DNA or RNA helicase